MDHSLGKGGLSGTVRTGVVQENRSLLSQATEAGRGAAV